MHPTFWVWFIFSTCLENLMLAIGRVKNGGDIHDIHELASTECLTKWGERQQRHTLAKELKKKN